MLYAWSSLSLQAGPVHGTTATLSCRPLWAFRLHTEINEFCPHSIKLLLPRVTSILLTKDWASYLTLSFNTWASNLLEWHPSVSLTTYTWRTDQRQGCWAVCATFHHNTSSPTLKHSSTQLQSQSKLRGFQSEDVASRPFAVNDTGRDVKCLCEHCVGEAATLTSPWRWAKDKEPTHHLLPIDM